MTEGIHNSASPRDTERATLLADALLSPVCDTSPDSTGLKVNFWTLCM